MQFVIDLMSPKKFVVISRKILPLLTIGCLLLASYGLVAGLLLTPADYIQGDGFRIIYVHAPCAFLSLFIYGVMAVSAALGIIFKLKLGFLVMNKSAAIGAGFTLLALITGSLWGKPMWGTWWIWDARLTSELILLFLYAGILLFQQAVAQRRSSALATAILVLAGSIDLPIIHYSVYWWNTLHQGPTLKLFAASSIDASMRLPLFAMIAACLFYYVIVLCLRINYELVAVPNHAHWLKK